MGSSLSQQHGCPQSARWTRGATRCGRGLSEPDSPIGLNGRTGIYEDDKAVAFMDISPLNKGHLLVVPKEHFEDIFEIDPDLYAHLMAVICRIAKVVAAVVAPDGMKK